jgi:hypothetical protein
MKTHFFTHPQASPLAKEDAEIADLLVRNKTVAIRHNGKAIHIAEYKSYTMHSQEASRFFLLDNEGLMIAYYANGQFWDSLGGTLIELK